MVNGQFFTKEEGAKPEGDYRVDVFTGEGNGRAYMVQQPQIGCVAHNGRHEHEERKNKEAIEIKEAHIPAFADEEAKNKALNPANKEDKPC